MHFTPQPPERQGAVSGGPDEDGIGHSPPPDFLEVASVFSSPNREIANHNNLGVSKQLFQTWLFAIFTRKRSFVLFCALWCSFAPLLLRSFALFCARRCLERLRLGISELVAIATKSRDLKSQGATGIDPKYLQEGE